MTQMRNSLLVLVVSLMLLGQVTAQISTQIPVSLPVNGYFLLGSDNRLLMFNTYSGEVQVLAEQQAPRPIVAPRLNLEGTDVVYADPLNVQVWRDFLGGNSTLLTFPYDPQRGVFVPEDWSPDGENVLGVVAGGAIGGYELQILNPQNNSFTTLRRYEIDEPLSEEPSLLFSLIGTGKISWNPVQAEWIAMQLETDPIGNEEIPADARFGVTVNLVFNHVTGETLLLNDYFPDQIGAGAAPIWSPDGRYLLTETVDINGTGRLHILEFRNSISGWTFDIVKTGVNEISSVEYWLGVQDFIIERNIDSSTRELIYHISQIIGGQLLRQEFLRIPLSSFSDDPLGNIYIGSWYLTAEVEEQQALSCLFDHAQPTRLSIGEPARVNFTSGTPLRLRAEPDLNLDPIQQMPEGTEFNVIGGPACVNAETDYYRFWQIQLSDRTVGWAAEAGMTDYFMEPLPDNVNCSTTIADTPTLLSAITTANATPEADTICLEAGTYTLTSSNNSGSDGPNGLPVITSDITLHGLGAGATILRDSTAPAFRILKVDTGARLVLENITVSGGDAGSGSGGGIRNLGTLELRNSVVENNLPDDLSGEGVIIQAER